MRLLPTAGAVAAGGATLLGAGGAAAARTIAPALGDLRARLGCDCSYQTRCLATFCSNGSPVEERRECRPCDGETTCDVWTDAVASAAPGSGAATNCRRDAVGCCLADGHVVGWDRMIRSCRVSLRDDERTSAYNFPPGAAFG